MFCTKCGQPAPDNSSICPQCGNPMVPSAAVPFSTDGSAAAFAPAPYQPAVDAKTDGKAVASLVCGVLMFLFGPLTGIPAIILGHISRSSIRKSLGKLKGEGMALAGLILGYISVAFIPIVLIIAAIAIPNLLRSRIVANEASAVNTVRTISAAATTYQTTNSSWPADLGQMVDARLIDPSLASGHKSGYRFTYVVTGDHFFVEATPINPGATGTRNICTSEDSVIHATKAPEACSIESPALE